jgi:hypothetical protein
MLIGKLSRDQKRFGNRTTVRNDDAVGFDVNIDRPPDCAGRDRVSADLGRELTDIHDQGIEISERF